MEVASLDIQHKASSLREAADANTVFLSVCAGYQLLGHYYKPFEGPELKGASLFDLYTEGSPTRYMTHMALECKFEETGTKTLVGYENHSGRTYLGSKLSRLAKYWLVGAITAKIAVKVLSTKTPLEPIHMVQFYRKIPGLPIC